MKMTEPIRNKQQIRMLTEFYLKRGQIRNHLLIVMGIHTALRISDLLRIRWEDVYDFKRQRIHSSLTLIEKKTGKAKTIALHPNILIALRLYTNTAKPGKFLFINPRTGQAIGRVQAYRIIRAAGEAIKLCTRVSCHSLRKTFGYHAWKDGKHPEIIMKIYNHSSLAITSRYLGITQDDIDAVYLDAMLTA